MRSKLLNQIEGLDKEKYIDVLLEQYRLYISSIEKVTERRANANSYFLTLTTAIGGGIGYVFGQNYELKEIFVIIIAISGILICIYWLFILDSYRKLNSGKFKVLNEVEKMLPLNLFEYEWNVLERGKNPKLYQRTSTVEKSIPRILILVYICVLILASILLV